MTYNQIKGSAEYILAQTRVRPKIALILGSGLNPIASEIENATRIPYKNIPRFNSTTNPDHEGVLIIGYLDKIPVAVMSGRLHQYEGNSMKECAYPVAVFKAMGIEKIIVTNAAGGINTDYRNGDFVLISDHIKFFNEGPLTGEDASILGGNRFFDMSDTYSEYLRNRVAGAFETETGKKIQQGVYAFMPGPQFETPAEIRMARVMGGDAAGMSTVYEATTANHCGIRTLGISLMTNMAAGILKQKLSGEEVNEAAARARDSFSTLVRECLPTLVK